MLPAWLRKVADGLTDGHPGLASLQAPGRVAVGGRGMGGPDRQVPPGTDEDEPLALLGNPIVRRQHHLRCAPVAGLLEVSHHHAQDGAPLAGGERLDVLEEKEPGGQACHQAEKVQV